MALFRVRFARRLRAVSVLVVCLVLSGCATRLSPFEVTVVAADGTPLEGAFVDVMKEARKDPFPKYEKRVLAVTRTDGRAEFLYPSGEVRMLVVHEDHWPLYSTIRRGDQIVLPESSEVWETLQSTRLSGEAYLGVWAAGFAYAQAQRGDLVFREDEHYEDYLECLEHLRREGILDAHDVEREIHSVPLPSRSSSEE
ncbi:MAG: hypothetical protein JJU00_00010 [Opitutales bacterium]|nr:hypothetical protein [Opitutales bacterium]